ncbi:MAG: DUF2946 family protein [Proteobacteria bacterium]|jgi:hypothetical protein|nr:DUF2946 family protein [Burkholderiaceae bacterium]MCH8855975.1 DUF2946 family protein [Pseudomonadota bacterium]|mmetsp:Transcript_65310/g.154274  ORF Transcript_65310/g.154274 Transcript_65310/m.154274 type:complete len:129 (+) Transcript_65310:1047-1433(+)
MPALTRAQARRQAWWWLAVLLLGMLAPGISAALAHARGDFSAWQDICRAPAANQAAKPKPIEAALDLLAQGHCPACHLAAADLAMPPPAPEFALRADLVAAAPERFWTAPVTAHAWRPASARAPPASI